MTSRLEPRTPIGREFAALMGPLEPWFDGRMIETESALAEHARKVFRFLLDIPGRAITHADIVDIDGVLEATCAPAASRGPVARVCVDVLALAEATLLVTPDREDRRELKRFYVGWKKTVQGLGDSDYSIIVADVGTILQSVNASDTGLRVELIEMFGEILASVDHEALTKLEQLDPPVLRADIEPGVLLNLAVAARQKNPSSVLRVGAEPALDWLRYWARSNPLADVLFRRWGWVVTLALESPLDESERGALDQTAALLDKRWREWSYRLDVGTLRRTLADEDAAPGKDEAAAESLFDDVPIVLFGKSRIGKTSFLCSFIHHAMQSNDAFRRVQLSREMLGYFDNHKLTWFENAAAVTAAAPQRLRFQATFDQERSATFETFDYRGEEAVPDQLPPELQERVRQARAFVFFVDETLLPNLDRCTASEKDLEPLRERFTFYAEIVRWHAKELAANGVSHVPIAVVVNKADLVLGEELPALSDGKGLVDDRWPASLFCTTSSPRWNPLVDERPRTVSEALRAALIWSRENARGVRVQRLVRHLVDAGAPFFEELLRSTFQFQVFLTCSAPPGVAGPMASPEASPLSPMLWLCRRLVDEQVVETAGQMKTLLETCNDDRRLCHYYLKYAVIKQPQYTSTMQRIADLRARVEMMRGIGKTISLVPRRLAYVESRHNEAIREAQRFFGNAKVRRWLPENWSLEDDLPGLAVTQKALARSLERLRRRCDQVHQDLDSFSRVANALRSRRSGARA